VSINEAHRDYLIREHAIKPEVIEAAGVESAERGMVFTWTDGVRTVRQARLDDAYRQAGGPRYLWPEGEKPVINRFRDPEGDAPLILAEGTCQHLAVASWAPEKHGVYGIMGCWGWSGCDLTWAEDRDVLVMFDADLTTNRDVWNAANALRDALELEGARSIRFILPPGSGKDGIDDVLARRPEDSRTPYLTRLISKATEKLGRPPASSNKKIAKKIMTEVPMALSDEGTVAIYRNGLYLTSADDFNMIATEYLGGDFSRGFRDNLHDFIAGQLRLEGRFLPESASEPVVNLKNGMLDLRTGELKPHDPAYMSVVQLPIEWDPDATCPTYEAWLKLVIPDQADDLEEVASTMLDPSRTPPKAAMLFGPSRSGKSTFLRIMVDIAGKKNTSAVTLHQLTENRFAAANLYGKILNSAAEISARHVDDLTIFKMMTGEDPIHADRKHGRQFMFKNRALFAFSANELPTVSESSRAYVERIKPFKFGQSFAGREDPTIEEKIRREELPGVLVRWVKAWQRLHQRGRYQDTKTDVQAEFETRSDRVRQFVMECCVIHEVDSVTISADQGMTKSEFAKAFNAWAEKNHQPRMAPRKIMDRVVTIAGVREVRMGAAKSRAVNVTVLPESQWGERDSVAGVADLPALPLDCVNNKITSTYKDMGGSRAGTATTATAPSGAADPTPPAVTDSDDSPFDF